MKINLYIRIFAAVAALCMGFATMAHAAAPVYVIAAVTNTSGDHFVSLGNFGAQAPYTNWVTAAATIQAAVDVAVDGEVVLVSNGTYTVVSNVAITKGVTVRSVNGAADTIIDGAGATRCVYMDHAAAVLDGFTVQRGYNPGGFGGGVDVNSGGTVKNCIMSGNQARDGGGVALDYGGLLLNCVIASNQAFDGSSTGFGGGVRCLFGGTVRGCLIVDNSSFTYGGGINVWAAGTIENCTVVSNTAPTGAGILTWNNGVVVNSILFSNIGDNWGINGVGNSFTNCCALGAGSLPGSGNITNDPLFVSATAGNYRLQAGSPCVNAGVNLGWMNGTVEMAGCNRIVDTTVDMGAYEFVPAPGGSGYTDKPDFAIAAITTVPAILTPGCSFSATVMVVNYGLAAADAGVLRLWLDHPAAAASREAGGVQLPVGTLALGGIKNIVFTGLTATNATGTFNLRAFVDADNATTELSEGNNQSTLTYTFAPGGGGYGYTGKPDFAIAAITTVPAILTPGCSFTATVMVVNYGLAAADAGVLRLWLDHPAAATNREAGGVQLPVGTLALGSITNIVFTGLTATNATGTFNLRAFVDADNATPEQSDGNNQSTLTYTFAPGGGGSFDLGANSWSRPDFAATELAFVGAAPSLAGEPFTVRVTIANRGLVAGNGGTLYLFASKADWALPGSEASADTNLTVGVLAAGGVGTLDVQLMTSSARGVHHLRAYVVSPETEWSTGDNQLAITYMVDSGAPIAPAPTPIHYVAAGNAGAQAPYTNWTTAAVCIQDAVGVATDGDTVLVTNGVYLLASEIQLARPVTVRSVNGAEATVVDGQGTTGCFYVTTNAVVDGFTIRRGTGHLFGPGDNKGGGVGCFGGGEVRNCTIEDNNAQLGGGVYCSPGGVVRNCLIRNNSAQGAGGVHCDGGAVLNCVIQGNSAFDVGGVSCFNGALVRNCLISDNSSYAYGGILVGTGSRVENSTVVGNNSSGYGGAMYVSAGAVLNTIICSNTVSPGAVGDPNLAGDTSLVSYCCVPLIIGGTGNIITAPQFMDPATGNYRVLSGSPCINAGSNLAWMPDATDLDGDPRIANSITDIGAYERREYTFTTLAGSGYQSGYADGLRGTARFNHPTDVAVDGAGNLYCGDWNNNVFRKISPVGLVTTLSNPAVWPTGCALDRNGNLYMAAGGWFGMMTISKMDTNGVVTVLAGEAWQSGYVDGTGGAARFDEPSGVAVDRAGFIYVADSKNARIRKISPAGVVTTLAGSGVQGHVDGQGTNAQFHWPVGIAVDDGGNVYVGEMLGQTIRKIDPLGNVTTLAGVYGETGAADGFGSAARFNTPAYLDIDGQGNLFVADFYNATIRRISRAGLVTTIAGLPGTAGYADGTGSTARFDRPFGIAVDVNGDLRVTDHYDETIRTTAPIGAIAPAPTPIHYVAAGNAGAQAPYTNWTTAAGCIQDAVGVATDGDTVLVTNGVYLLASEIQLARPVTVRSVNGAEATVVDGQGATGCFYVTTNAVVDGFTIRRGTGHLFGPGDNKGGGVGCFGGGEVRNCTIEDNNAQVGGGVYCSPGGVVRNCLIRNNSAQGAGGVHCDGGAVLNCVIQGNSAFDVGGVSCFNGALVRNCLISDNSSYAYGGMLVGTGSRVESSTVVGNNSSGNGGAMYVSAGSVLNTIICSNTVSPGAVGDPNLAGDTSLVSYCCVPLIIGGTGNITNAPLFADVAMGNYRLQAGSPCANAGINQAWMADTTDLDGHRRIMTVAVDMGAYETPIAYRVTVLSGANGSISPGGIVAVVEGDDQTFLILPDAGYRVQDVLVDNVSVGAVTSLSLRAVSADHALRASFAPASWSKADFAVESIQFTPTTLLTGAVFAATVTVRNRGDIAGDAGMLRVWVSRATLVTPGEAGSAEVAVGRLAPGESRTLAFPGLTAPAIAGTHHLRACVNADNVTSEYSWGDNQMTATYTIAPGGGGSFDPGANSWSRPDFTVTELAFVGAAPSLAGEPFAVRVTVANRGLVAGNGGTLYLFASKADWALPGSEASADTNLTVGVLAAGGERTFDVQLPTPSARGVHHLRAYVVSPETEWSTGDNQSSITYGLQTVQVSIAVVPGVGVVVTWNNYWGDTYTVYRKADLSGTFEPLATNIPSARPAEQNVFIDANPPAGGAALYKVGASVW